MKMNRLFLKITTGLLSLFLLAGCGIFGASQDDTPSERPSSMKDSSSDEGIKAFSDVIEDSFQKDEGLFTVYEDDGSFFYEIPDTLLGREMLMVSRITKTADGIGYGGERFGNQVLRWERRQDDILLRRVSFENTASDTLSIYEAVQNSNFEPIIMTFEIKALNEDSTGTVIEVTDLFESDVPALGLEQRERREYQVRRLDGSRTFIESVKSFPENIEARHLLTYEASEPPSNSSTGTISLEINHSMILMREEPLQSRVYDQRVGYFSVTKRDYGLDVHRAETTQDITRWSLVPKDKEAYMNGELV
jgi:hypothetical protein